MTSKLEIGKNSRGPARTTHCFRTRRPNPWPPSVARLIPRPTCVHAPTRLWYHKHGFAAPIIYRRHHDTAPTLVTIVTRLCLSWSMSSQCTAGATLFIIRFSLVHQTRLFFSLSEKIPFSDIFNNMELINYNI